MANVVYVGNYPSSFTDEDILNIFQDFEGLVLLRSVRKNLKCYSFVLCQSQDQVVDVVFALHDTDAEGRNLIVRASDDELQEMIERINFEDEYGEDEYGIGNEHVSDQSCNSFSAECSSVAAYNAMKFRQPQKPGRIASSRLASDEQFSKKTNTFNKVNQHSDRILNSRFSYKSKTFQKNGKIEAEDQRFCDKSYEQGNSYLNNVETASCVSYSTSARSDSLSPSSVTSSRYSGKKSKGEKFSFVSIFNFPDGTSVDELHELFSDYMPHKIIMRNSQCQDEDQPTEAVACFFKSKYATDSIMNLDNTLYRGKVLLVTECDDTSFVSDLVKVHQK